MEKQKADLHTLMGALREYFEKNAKNELDAVLLFGSQAKDETDARSDVDLGFLFRDDPDYLRMGYHVAKLESIVNRRIDPLLLNSLERKNPLLAHEVVENHRLVYLKDKERYIDFKTAARLFYLDSLPLIEANRKSLRERIREDKIGERCYVGTH